MLTIPPECVSLAGLPVCKNCSSRRRRDSAHRMTCLVFCQRPPGRQGCAGQEKNDASSLCLWCHMIFFLKGRTNAVSIYLSSSIDKIYFSLPIPGYFYLPILSSQGLLWRIAVSIYAGAYCVTKNYFRIRLPLNTLNVAPSSSFFSSSRRTKFIMALSLTIHKFVILKDFCW
mmetsp:Transcript_13088/g.19367  ORF Transcript_13088/g.19367 Transcript_13088/m.19367 type:complete len:172 (-) Transcript_13088:467-982(-)